MNKIRDLLRLFRVHQYIKNLFIFAPLFFAFSFDYKSSLRCTFAFLFFSLLASSIYIFNDLQDIQSDRLHPKKKFRPIASGIISPKKALCIALVLVFFSGAGGYATLGDNFLVLCALYIFLNLAYSLRLKHIAILDVCIIAIGFIIRLFIGAYAGGVKLSHWIIITTFFLSLFLAFCKRRDDLQILKADGIKMRKSIDGYSPYFIDFCITISATMSILSYVMWSISPDSMTKLHSSYLYLTSFFVILGIMRYGQIVYVKSGGGSPTQVVLKDFFMHLILLGWILSFVILIGS